MNKSSFQLFIEHSILTLLSIVKIALISNKKIDKKIKLSNSRCLILGNGPSLTESLEKLSSSLDTLEKICVNHFAESEFYGLIKPKFYVLNAPEMWMENVDPFHKKKGEVLFDSICENTTWKLHLFIPSTARKYKKWKLKIKKNPNININYFNTTPIEGFDWFVGFCIKKGLGLPRPHSVLIPSIAIACNLGSKFIYLIGAENSIFKEITVTDSNEVLLTQKHFYDPDEIKARPMDKLGVGARKIHEVLQKFVYSFYGFWVLQKFASKRGVQIINATPNSFIDAFKKINVEEIIPNIE